MSTREKILVGLMIVSVLLGTMVLFSDGQKETASKGAAGNQTPLTQMLTRLTAQFGNDPFLESNRYALARAQLPWQKNLFPEGPETLMATTEATVTAEALPANVALVYSGYIETSRRRVAIINGTEYVMGDQLEDSVYTVEQITPSQVVLGSPQQTRIVIPLVDGWEVRTPQ